MNNGRESGTVEKFHIQIYKSDQYDPTQPLHCSLLQPSPGLDL